MEQKCELLRHALATIAYRGGKALRGAPESFAWALSIAKGASKWNASTPLDWDAEVSRFFASLGRFDEYLASDETLACPAEQIFQGPIADALTHVGQLMMLRRMAGAPVRSENYFMAAIVTGRVGGEQTPPRREFD